MRVWTDVPGGGCAQVAGGRDGGGRERGAHEAGAHASAARAGGAHPAGGHEANSSDAGAHQGTAAAGPAGHRVLAFDPQDVTVGCVRYAPVKSLWFLGMASGALIGGSLTASWAALGVFVGLTSIVLLLGHSLGNHRKLVHDSFQCPRWLEYFLVYLGVQVGLAGPIGLLRQHELRDYAQRLPNCHDYLRHGRSMWVDAWWQLHCTLELRRAPVVRIEPRIAQDRFYRFLEHTWMAQQLPGALLLYAAGGWAFIWWGVCARVTAGVLGHWLIGYFAHNHGQMVYEVRGAAVQGRNVRLTSLLTMGECWHNNHHAFPGSARLGLRPGEWDPGWWMLQGLRRLGWVWDVKLPPDLPSRPELIVAGAPGSMNLSATNTDVSREIRHELAA